MMTRNISIEDDWQRLNVLNCSRCGLRTSDSGLLQAHHCKSKTQPITAGVSYNRENDKFICSLCRVEMPEDDFKEHLEAHISLNPYRCKYCDSEYMDRSDIYEHVRLSHEQEQRSYLLKFSAKTKEIIQRAKNNGKEFYKPTNHRVLPVLSGSSDLSSNSDCSVSSNILSSQELIADSATSQLKATASSTSTGYSLPNIVISGLSSVPSTVPHGNMAVPSHLVNQQNPIASISSERPQISPKQQGLLFLVSPLTTMPQRAFLPVSSAHILQRQVPNSFPLVPVSWRLPSLRPAKQTNTFTVYNNNLSVVAQGVQTHGAETNVASSTQLSSVDQVRRSFLTAVTEVTEGHFRNRPLVASKIPENNQKTNKYNKRSVEEINLEHPVRENGSGGFCDNLIDESSGITSSPGHQLVPNSATLGSCLNSVINGEDPATSDSELPMQIRVENIVSLSSCGEDVQQNMRNHALYNSHNALPLADTSDETTMQQIKNVESDNFSFLRIIKGYFLCLICRQKWCTDYDLFFKHIWKKHTHANDFSCCPTGYSTNCARFKTIVDAIYANSQVSMSDQIRFYFMSQSSIDDQTVSKSTHHPDDSIYSSVQHKSLACVSSSGEPQPDSNVVTVTQSTRTSENSPYIPAQILPQETLVYSEDSNHPADHTFNNPEQLRNLALSRRWENLQNQISDGLISDKERDNLHKSIEHVARRPTPGQDIVSIVGAGEVLTCQPENQQMSITVNSPSNVATSTNSNHKEDRVNKNVYEDISDDDGDGGGSSRKEQNYFLSENSYSDELPLDLSKKAPKSGKSANELSVFSLSTCETSVTGSGMHMERAATENLRETDEGDNSLNLFFQCGSNHCLFASANSLDFQAHNQRAHASEQELLCVYCGFRSTSSKHLVSHMEDHIRNDKKTFSCSLLENSDKVAQFENNDIKFIIRMLKTSLAANSESDAVLQFGCNICQSEFVALEELEEHLEQSLLKVIKCTHCESYFLNFLSWQKHMTAEHLDTSQIHSINKKLLCKDRIKSKKVHEHKSQDGSNIFPHSNSVKESEITVQEKQYRDKNLELSSLVLHVMDKSGQQKVSSHNILLPEVQFRSEGRSHVVLSADAQNKNIHQQISNIHNSVNLVVSLNSNTENVSTPTVTSMNAVEPLGGWDSVRHFQPVSQPSVTSGRVDNIHLLHTAPQTQTVGKSRSIVDPHQPLSQVPKAPTVIDCRDNVCFLQTVSYAPFVRNRRDGVDHHQSVSEVTTVRHNFDFPQPVSLAPIIRDRFDFHQPVSHISIVRDRRNSVDPHQSLSQAPIVRDRKDGVDYPRPVSQAAPTVKDRRDCVDYPRSVAQAPTVRDRRDNESYHQTVPYAPIVRGRRDIVDPHQPLSQTSSVREIVDPHQPLSQTSSVREIVDPHQPLSQTSSVREIVDPHQPLLQAAPTVGDRKDSVYPHQPLSQASSVRDIVDPHQPLSQAAPTVRDRRDSVDPHQPASQAPSVKDIVDPHQPLLQAPTVKGIVDPHQPLSQAPSVRDIVNPHQPLSQAPSVRDIVDPHQPLSQAAHTVRDIVDPHQPLSQAAPTVRDRRDSVDPHQPASQAPSVKDIVDPHQPLLQAPTVKDIVDPHQPLSQAPSVRDIVDPHQPLSQTPSVRDIVDPHQPLSQAPSVRDIVDPHQPLSQAAPTVRDIVDPHQPLSQAPSVRDIVDPHQPLSQAAHTVRDIVDPHQPLSQAAPTVRDIVDPHQPLSQAAPSVRDIVDPHQPLSQAAPTVRDIVDRHQPLSQTPSVRDIVDRHQPLSQAAPTVRDIVDRHQPLSQTPSMRDIVDRHQPLSQAAPTVRDRVYPHQPASQAHIVNKLITSWHSSVLKVSDTSNLTYDRLGSSVQQSLGNGNFYSINLPDQFKTVIPNRRDSMSQVVTISSSSTAESERGEYEQVDVQSHNINLANVRNENQQALVRSSASTNLSCEREEYDQEYEQSSANTILANEILRQTTENNNYVVSEESAMEDEKSHMYMPILITPPLVSDMSETELDPAEHTDNQPVIELIANFAAKRNELPQRKDASQTVMSALSGSFIKCQSSDRVIALEDIENSCFSQNKADNHTSDVRSQINTSCLAISQQWGDTDSGKEIHTGTMVNMGLKINRISSTKPNFPRPKSELRKNQEAENKLTSDKDVLTKNSVALNTNESEFCSLVIETAVTNNDNRATAESCLTNRPFHDGSRQKLHILPGISGDENGDNLHSIKRITLGQMLDPPDVTQYKNTCHIDQDPAVLPQNTVNMRKSSHTSRLMYCTCNSVQRNHGIPIIDQSSMKTFPRKCDKCKCKVLSKSSINSILKKQKSSKSRQEKTSSSNRPFLKAQADVQENTNDSTLLGNVHRLIDECGGISIDQHLKSLYTSLDGKFVCKRCKRNYNSLKRIHCHIFNCQGKVGVIHCSFCQYQGEHEKAVIIHMKRIHNVQALNTSFKYCYLKTPELMEVLQSHSVSPGTFMDICAKLTCLVHVRKDGNMGPSEDSSSQKCVNSNIISTGSTYISSEKDGSVISTGQSKLFNSAYMRPHEMKCSSVNSESSVEISTIDTRKSFDDITSVIETSEGTGTSVIGTSEGTDTSVIKTSEGMGTSVIKTSEGTSVIGGTSEGTSIIKTSEGTSIIKTSESTSVIETSEGTSVIGTSEGTSVIETSEGTSVIGTSDDTSVIGTSEDTSVIGTSVGTSIIGTLESTFVIGTSESTSAIGSSKSTSGTRTSEGISIIGTLERTSVMGNSDDTSVMRNSEGTCVLVNSEDTYVMEASESTSVVEASEGNLTSQKSITDMSCTMLSVVSKMTMQLAQSKVNTVRLLDKNTCVLSAHGSRTDEENKTHFSRSEKKIKVKYDDSPVRIASHSKREIVADLCKSSGNIKVDNSNLAVKRKSEDTGSHVMRAHKTSRLDAKSKASHYIKAHRSSADNQSAEDRATETMPLDMAKISSNDMTLMGKSNAGTRGSEPTRSNNANEISPNDTAVSKQSDIYEKVVSIAQVTKSAKDIKGNNNDKAFRSKDTYKIRAFENLRSSEETVVNHSVKAVRKQSKDRHNMEAMKTTTSRGEVKISCGDSVVQRKSETMHDDEVSNPETTRLDKDTKVNHSDNTVRRHSKDGTNLGGSETTRSYGEIRVSDTDTTVYKLAKNRHDEESSIPDTTQSAKEIGVSNSKTKAYEKPETKRLVTNIKDTNSAPNKMLECIQGNRKNTPETLRSDKNNMVGCKDSTVRRPSKDGHIAGASEMIRSSTEINLKHSDSGFKRKLGATPDNICTSDTTRSDNDTKDSCNNTQVKKQSDLKPEEGIIIAESFKIDKEIKASQNDIVVSSRSKDVGDIEVCKITRPSGDIKVNQNIATVSRKSEAKRPDTGGAAIKKQDYEHNGDISASETMRSSKNIKVSCKGTTVRRQSKDEHSIMTSEVTRSRGEVNVKYSDAAVKSKSDVMQIEGINAAEITMSAKEVKVHQIDTALMRKSDHINADLILISETTLSGKLTEVNHSDTPVIKQAITRHKAVDIAETRLNKQVNVICNDTEVQRKSQDRNEGVCIAETFRSNTETQVNYSDTTARRKSKDGHNMEANETTRSNGDNKVKDSDKAVNRKPEAKHPGTEIRITANKESENGNVEGIISPETSRSDREIRHCGKEYGRKSTDKHKKSGGKLVNHKTAAVWKQSEDGHNEEISTIETLRSDTQATVIHNDTSNRHFGDRLLKGPAETLRAGGENKVSNNDSVVNTKLLDGPVVGVSAPETVRSHTKVNVICNKTTMRGSSGDGNVELIIRSSETTASNNVNEISHNDSTISKKTDVICQKVVSITETTKSAKEIKVILNDSDKAVRRQSMDGNKIGPYETKSSGETRVSCKNATDNKKTDDRHDEGVGCADSSRLAKEIKVIKDVAIKRKSNDRSVEGSSAPETVRSDKIIKVYINDTADRGHSKDGYNKGATKSITFGAEFNISQKDPALPIRRKSLAVHGEGISMTENAKLDTEIRVNCTEITVQRKSEEKQGEKIRDSESTDASQLLCRQDAVIGNHESIRSDTDIKITHKDTAVMRQSTDIPDKIISIATATRSDKDIASVCNVLSQSEAELDSGSFSTSLHEIIDSNNDSAKRRSEDTLDDEMIIQMNTGANVKCTELALKRKSEERHDSKGIKRLRSEDPIETATEGKDDITNPDSTPSSTCSLYTSDTSNSYTELKKHIKSQHPNDKSAKMCSVSRDSQLDTSSNSVTKKRKVVIYKCTRSNCNFKSKWDADKMKKHITINHPYYSCGYCGAPYTSSSLLYKHLRFVHRTLNPNMSYGTISLELLFKGINQHNTSPNGVYEKPKKHTASKGKVKKCGNKAGREFSTSEQDDNHTSLCSLDANVTSNQQYEPAVCSKKPIVTIEKASEEYSENQLQISQTRKKTHTDKIPQSGRVNILEHLLLELRPSSTDQEIASEKLNASSSSGAVANNVNSISSRTESNSFERAVFMNNAALVLGESLDSQTTGNKLMNTTSEEYNRKAETLSTSEKNVAKILMCLKKTVRPGPVSSPNSQPTEMIEPVRTDLNENPNSGQCSDTTDTQHLENLSHQNVLTTYFSNPSPANNQDQKNATTTCPFNQFKQFPKFTSAAEKDICKISPLGKGHSSSSKNQDLCLLEISPVTNLCTRNTAVHCQYQMSNGMLQSETSATNISIDMMLDGVESTTPKVVTVPKDVTTPKVVTPRSPLQAKNAKNLEEWTESQLEAKTVAEGMEFEAEIMRPTLLMEGITVQNSSRVTKHSEHSSRKYCHIADTELIKVPTHKHMSKTDYPFRCTLCRRITKCLNDIEAHFQECHPTCAVQMTERKSGFVYSSTGHCLNEKVGKKMAQDSHFCRCCSFRSNERSAVEAHIRNAHSRRDVQVFSLWRPDLPETSRQLSSDVTSFYQASGSNSSTVKCYHCNLCNDVQSSEFLFRLHLAKHPGFKHKLLLEMGGLFMCHVCGYIAKSSGDMAQHTGGHISERQFKCLMCEYDSHSKNGVRIHIKNVHSINICDDAGVIDRKKQRSLDLRPTLVNINPQVLLENPFTQHPNSLRDLLTSNGINVIDLPDCIRSSILTDNHEEYFEVYE